MSFPFAKNQEKRRIMRKKNVKEWKVAVLGAGTMGQCIAQFLP